MPRRIRLLPMLMLFDVSSAEEVYTIRYGTAESEPAQRDSDIAMIRTVYTLAYSTARGQRKIARRHASIVSSYARAGGVIMADSALQISRAAAFIR